MNYLKHRIPLFPLNCHRHRNSLGTGHEGSPNAPIVTFILLCSVWSAQKVPYSLSKWKNLLAAEPLNVWWSQPQWAIWMAPLCAIVCWVTRHIYWKRKARSQRGERYSGGAALDMVNKSSALLSKRHCSTLAHSICLGGLFWIAQPFKFGLCACIAAIFSFIYYDELMETLSEFIGVLWLCGVRVCVCVHVCRLWCHTHLGVCGIHDSFGSRAS